MTWGNSWRGVPVRLSPACGQKWSRLQRICISNSAAALRDQIQAIEKVVERQKVVSADYVDSDVIAMARSNGEACVQVFFIRGGKLIGREYFLMEGTENSLDSDVIGSFIKQFYDQAPTVPAQVLLPNDIEEVKIINEWLNTRRGGTKVEMRVPTDGPQQELIAMATENAQATLAALKAEWEADKNRQMQGLTELQEALAAAKGPQPHRMLRYFQYAGHGRGGQHGGLRARGAEKSLVPAL